LGPRVALSLGQSMGNELSGFQTTLKHRVSLSGVGVHSGVSVSINLLPADADTGVIFHKIQADGEVIEVRAVSGETGPTDLCTVLGKTETARIGTIEHIMATLSALGIDNVIILIEGSEVPIMDGSGQAFVEAIDQAGTITQAAKRRFIRVTKPLRVDLGGSWAEFRPYDGTRFEVEIDFDCAVIGRQIYTGDLTPATYRRDLARARTFGFMRHVEHLWASGHALGSSLENSIVIGDDDRVVNQGGLRWTDEFVRHKTLDAVGDLALAGAQILGCYRSYRGGHKLNAMALRALLSDSTSYEIVESKRVQRRGAAAELVAVNAPVFSPWML
jgi:UDP-3-O-[3-hydroxymyristoyl] N-acetylglucosamine deacetylase